jgi:hypothetical protein
MRVCDNCEAKKPRRLVKIKDILYGKGFTEIDLCEKCYKQLFGQLEKKRLSGHGT